MVSSKAFFNGSSHAYLTSSLYRASALNLRKSVRHILDILAQYNRPKPTPTSTSNLGFSFFIYTNVMLHCNTLFVLHFYIIKMYPLRVSSKDIG